FPVALIAVIYRPLVFEGRILAGLDTEAYFYPNASYLAASLRTGRIPLWNPLIFAGVPFLANSQVGALYPPNWLYLIGHVSSVAIGFIRVVDAWARDTVGAHPGRLFDRLRRCDVCRRKDASKRGLRPRPRFAGPPDRTLDLRAGACDSSDRRPNSADRGAHPAF